MNDKSIILYTHGYALNAYAYNIAIIYKSSIINPSKKMIQQQLYNKFKIKLDQKGIRFNVYRFI